MPACPSPCDPATLPGAFTPPPSASGPEASLREIVQLRQACEAAERRARSAEQLASVGLFGACLAHEIRNPLMTIKGVAQMLPEHHANPAFREKFFTLVLREVERIDTLTRRILRQAAPQDYTQEDFALHPLLQESVELTAARCAASAIRVECDWQAAPDRIRHAPAALEQVVLNLLANAISALDRQTGPRWIRLTTRSVARGIELTVEDNGPGIPPQQRAHLFEPFHSTTKPDGTGLGLAICCNTLASLNSSLSLDPAVPGKGALFRIQLPCPPSF